MGFPLGRLRNAPLRECTSSTTVIVGSISGVARRWLMAYLLLIRWHSLAWYLLLILTLLLTISVPVGPPQEQPAQVIGNSLTHGTVRFNDSEIRQSEVGHIGRNFFFGSPEGNT